MRIDGREIAQEILVDLRTQTAELKRKNVAPHLAIILVGNDHASVAYVNQKKIKAENIGAKTTIIHLSSDITESQLIEKIKQFNQDKNIHGIIVQQPLPQNINTGKITQIVDSEKDVDGFNLKSKFEMPIAMAVLKILEKIGIQETDLKSKRIVIVGKGETGGKPIINALQKMGISPTIIDSKTKNPENPTKKADIIISAVGKSNAIVPEMLKRNVILISIGLHKENGKIVGDYNEEKIKDIASFYTPSPGGVGPVNVACLLKNLIFSAENSRATTN